ncbi:MAG: hypothetical protein HN560_05065 [Anaerolineae bacterium]|nr:hypothetical protein [Anaerolineae bacterium]
MFDPNERDEVNAPAIYLRERLYQLGYDLKTADDNSLDDCEWVFFYEANSVQAYSGWRGIVRKLKHRLQRRKLLRDFYGECILAGLKQRMIFFPWEALAVSPENWNPELHKLFPVIFTWHDEYVDGDKFFKIHLPQTGQFPNVPNVPFRGRKLLVNISRNKSASHSRELYSARRASIRHFERTQPDKFDLYGVGWNRPTNFLEKTLPFSRRRYSSYRGKVQNKWDVLPHYRFSLCYENIKDEPGYVTEKIFDCMRARCVPIYWGAPNITDYVDEEAFIDRRQFETDEELEAYLLRVTEQEFEKFQDAMQNYLQSERFAKFLPLAFADTIISVLDLEKSIA